MPPGHPKETLRRKKYTPEDMHQAILAVRGGASVAGAARQFGVPRVTLMDKLAGRTSELCKMGRRPVLGEDEELVLVRWILQCRSAGFPISTDQLIYSTQQLLKELGKEDLFQNGVPTKRWVEGFLKRRPELSLRECQNLTSTRANVTVENIQQWFQEVKTYLEDNDQLKILQDPSRVFNCDETAFFLCPDKGKVIVGRGDKSVYRVSANNEKENVTVLLNCSADGSIAPCMVVFPYDRWPPRVIASIPDEWGAGKTENGWMTAQSFYEYIGNVFDPYLTEKGIKRPVILFMDGHTSHMSLEVSKLCSSKEIILVALYPNATHILQPLDVAVFHPLKGAWRRAVTNWRFQNGGRKMKNEDFAPLAKEVLDSGAVKPETIRNGFKTCGLLSLDPKKANLTKILGQSSGHKPAEMTANLLALQRHLYFIESRIETQVLNSFREEGNINIEDRSLFNLWKGLKTDISNLKKSPRQEMAELTNETPSELPDSFTCIENDHSPEIDGPNNDVSTTEGEVILFEDDPIIVTIPPDPNPAEECASNISFDNVSLINLQEVAPEHGIELDRPSCSWDFQFFEDIEPLAKEVHSSTPSSNLNVSIETPSRGITLGDLQLQNLTSLTPTDHDYNMSPKTPRPEPNASGDANTPPTDIPSPFKNCLMWPEPKLKTSNLKRKKVRTPSVVTSKLWKEYHEKIKEERTKKEQAVAERKLQREVKLKIKQERTEKQTKRKLQVTPKQSAKKNKADKSEDEALDNDLEENENDHFDLERCCSKPRLPDSFKIGLWVVVSYTKRKGGCEKFVGQILSVNVDDVEVKFLVKKGHKFVWPTKEDIDTVPIQDIVTTLDEPLFDRRGYLTFVNHME